MSGTFGYDEQMSLPTLEMPTLGTEPLGHADVDYFQRMDKAFAGLGAHNNPMWDDTSDLMMANMVNKSLGFINSSPALNGQINDRLAHRFSVEQLNQPRDSTAILHTAIRYAIENPFVAKAGRVKADFTCLGFRHKTHNAVVKDYYDYQARRLALKFKIKQIAWTLVTVGICPIWWGGEDGKPIQNLLILDPRQCHFEWNFGVASLYLKVDQAMEDAVRDPEGRMNIVNRAKFRSMPAYWVKQIQDQISAGKFGNCMIELQPGSFAVVQNRYCPFNRTSYSNTDGLPTQSIFSALQRYQLLTAGDFAVAWGQKNVITMISEGDPKSEAKMWTPATTERLSRLQAQFQRPDNAFTVYVDPTTEVRFAFPPSEIFQREKYVQPTIEIKEALSLPSFMWTADGENTNYANAVAEMKLLRQEIMALREILEEQFFIPLYGRLQQNARHAAKDIVLPTFDMNALQEDALWLKQIPALYGVGACSVEFLQETFGIDVDYEVEQMTQEHKKYGSKTQKDVTIFSPLYNPGHPEDPNADKGGHPEGDQPIPKPATRSPRTAGK